MGKKYIIREVPAESAELQYFFDTDAFSEAGGDWCMNLFILYYDSYSWSRYGGFNLDTYEQIKKQAENIVDGFCNIDPSPYAYYSYNTYKECMLDNGIEYNSRKCYRLKQWLNRDDATDPEGIAEFLTITTGRQWKSIGVHGYCQCDFCNVVFCTDFYDQQTAKTCGEVWLGCATEYSVSELDDAGEETDTVYGFIVADCQAWTPEDAKKLVCDWYGCQESEAILETISHSYTTTHYDYVEAC